MTRDRHALPQLEGPPFLTDGGLETVLCFQQGIALPAFASFVLLKDEAGRQTLVRYYEEYLAIAVAHGAGFVLESPTWRASRDWAEPTGRTVAEIDAANREAILLMAGIRTRWEGAGIQIVVSGCVGPRGDGYDPGAPMSESEAQRYHAGQIEIFAASAADMATGTTITNTPEAIGLVRAAQAAGLPVALSFTVETDGSLPSGQTLEDAILAVDAATGSGPAYYMVNCAHPTHFAGAVSRGGAWTERIRGLRPNASRCSHAELDECTELDDGNPSELGSEIRALAQALPRLAVLGGCCGTDQRHVRAVAEAWFGVAQNVA